MRREIEAVGGLKLVYIDPPFDLGADFTFNIEVGDGETVAKESSVVEEVAYRDTWGRGTDSYLGMIYERLNLIREILADDGSIFVHSGPKVSHVVKSCLDEVFG
jgi:adenine specific DNA methylase Mod